MNATVGALITIEMKKRGTGPKLWARARGYHPQTVNRLLHHGLGSKHGGPATQAIFAELIKEGYIDENHEFVEQAEKAS